MPGIALLTGCAAPARPRLVSKIETGGGAAQMRALAEMENSGLVPLLMADRAEDLARMHALFARVEGGSELLRAGMVRSAIAEHRHIRLGASEQTGWACRSCGSVEWRAQGAVRPHGAPDLMQPPLLRFWAETGGHSHAACVMRPLLRHLDRVRCCLSISSSVS